MKAGRVVLLVGAGILLVIVLVVSLWVIPRVAADTSPMASPEGAVTSFWTFAIAGIGVLLFGLWLWDGAVAFGEEGPGMHAVTTVLFACVGGEGFAAMLAFVGAADLARSSKREPRAT